jgi:hypothetical protein
MFPAFFYFSEVFFPAFIFTPIFLFWKRTLIRMLYAPAPYARALFSIGKIENNQ